MWTDYVTRNGDKIYKAIQRNPFVSYEIKAAVLAQVNIGKDHNSSNLPDPLDRELLQRPLTVNLIYILPTNCWPNTTSLKRKKSADLQYGFQFKKRKVNEMTIRLKAWCLLIFRNFKWPWNFCYEYPVLLSIKPVLFIANLGSEREDPLFCVKYTSLWKRDSFELSL